QGDGDGVVAHVAELTGRGGQGVVEDVAVDGAGDHGVQGRVGIAVGLGLVVGRDGGVALADGHAVIGRGDGVVAVGTQGDGDRVVAHVAELTGRGGQGVV